MYDTVGGQGGVAIVTGGSRGLGLALVRSLAERGWRVVVDARGGDDLARAVGRLRNVTWIAGDVADAEHRNELIEAAGARIDLVVNNAGTLGPSPRPQLADYPLEALGCLFAVNVVAPLALVQRALPRLTTGAALVNVTSDASREPYEGWGGYGAVKAALDQLTAILAAEHPDRRVYAFDPGDMRTVMHQQAFPGEDISDRPLPEESIPALLELIDGDLPSGRYTAAGLAAAIAR